jgi:hypothetical protein
MKKVLVVPTIREEGIHKFIKHWGLDYPKMAGVETIVIEDSPTRTFELPESIIHYSHQDIDADLEGDSWIIPRKSDAIRSYGFLKAAEMGADVVITMDDDCYPGGPDNNAFWSHARTLQTYGLHDAWHSTITGMKPRGFPYANTLRRVRNVINIGMWSTVPDLDAPTALLEHRSRPEWSVFQASVPVGKYVPMCGMNLSFSYDVLPMMYFLLMGPEYPYDRFADIWCGIFAKKICDRMGYGMQHGLPIVQHVRASNVFENLIKEAPGIKMNEKLWEIVDGVKLIGTRVMDCYIELAQVIGDELEDDYFQELSRAMVVWTRLADVAMFNGGWERGEEK